MTSALFRQLASIKPIRLAVSWTLLIILLLSIPGRDLPDVDMIALDKPVHAFLFFVFTIVWSRVFSRGPIRNILLAGCLAIVFAVLSELYQGLLPFDRTPDRFDVLANWIGSGIAVVFLFWRDRKSPSAV